MRLKRLAALPLVLMLTGCPNLMGASGNSELSPKAIAVTENSGAGPTANAYLEWPPVTNASTYHVVRTTSEGTLVRQKSERTSFTEQVGAGYTVTYKVLALDSGGNEKAASTPVTIEVMTSEVAAPTGITVDGKSASPDNITSLDANANKPTLSWSAVENATHYFVKITDPSDKTIFAAFTKEPQVTVGTLPIDGLKIPQYPQVKGDGIPSGKVVQLVVSAIRANDSDLKVATAFDIRSSVSFDLYRK